MVSRGVCTMASISELAGIYSAFILHDDEATVREDKINALIKTTSVNVGPLWPGLFAKALANVNIGSLICNVGVGGPDPAVGATLLPRLRGKWKPRKKSQEFDVDMAFGLFD
uniref:60S acidic ribosomal protein P1-like n=1 Tax=Jaculus jaculus TaxID=51337 RepID=UPI001E1B158E|nr:60S acidic ribosomal protein P1-like [Jaculus jaculus]